MGRKYRYIGPVERAEIERLHNGGGSPAFIAERVGVHVSAIYRELPKGYTGGRGRVRPKDLQRRGGATGFRAQYQAPGREGRGSIKAAVIAVLYCDKKTEGNE